MSKFIEYLGLFLLLFFAFGAGNESYSQIDYYYYTGAGRGSLDTLAYETGKQVSSKSAGLLEKEIDPKEYYLGPNDVLEISIISLRPKEFDITVSPECFLMIPEVGLINVKNKTLAETDSLIREKMEKVFNSKGIYILLKKLREFKVIVTGAVQKPSIVSATAADRISEVIEKAGGMKFNASLRRIKINRDNREIQSDLLKFYTSGDKSCNPNVLGGDIIDIPVMNFDYGIQISGEVGLPGKFEFVDGDSLSTLIKFAHGFIESSRLDSVEIVRFESNSSQIRKWYVNINSWRSLGLNSPALPNNFPLFLGDRVFIRRIPDWHEDKKISIDGEVRYPGVYAIEESKTTLYDIISRAGGLMEDAALESSLLIRRKEVSTEDKMMDRLSKIPSAEMSENERRIFESRSSERRGVMSINFLKAIENPKSSENITLINNDSIYIPQKKNFVNIQGRVNNPGLVIYNPKYSYTDYINLAGGFGFRADIGETFIIKSKGQQYLAKSMDYIIEPGDYILVPPVKEVSFMEIFTTGLTIITQFITITGVIIALIKTR